MSLVDEAAGGHARKTSDQPRYGLTARLTLFTNRVGRFDVRAVFSSDFIGAMWV